MKKMRQATVTIALIEVTGFETTKLEDKPRVLMFRLRLGTEKLKSKLIKSHKDVVQVQEIFNFNLYNSDSLLELTLSERDNIICRNIIDLNELEQEKTHRMRINSDYELKNIQIFLLLTISGTLNNTLYGMDETEMRNKDYLLRKKYAWYRLCGQFSNIGSLNVIVYGAKGLSSADCFCILNLNNERVQTQTDYKTNAPSWMKIVTFTVTDITSVLEVIIYDEKKNDEVGRVAIPLLKAKCGKNWYALKCCNLKDRAKGNNPRILLEINLVWNAIKAAIRVINPKEPNYLQQEEKLDRHVFARNLSRAKVVTTWIMNAFDMFKTCFQWESMKLNVASLALWLTFCYHFKLWMLPLLLLIPFVWYKPDQYTIFNWKSKIVNEFSPVNNKEAKENKEQDKNVSIRQKINQLQEIIQSIQNLIGRIADFGESVKNLFNFTLPFVSLLAIVMLFVSALVMYIIPFNYICMFWGIKKFLYKIFRPNRIPNNEIMDLLSRVPDDILVSKYEELPVGDTSDDKNCE
ncbi:multiple C2 and transmembrane domain-containing protein-like isoform X1 [Danaus plexippus]|uniref:multiple C2 and transmembrane domain-containing protein-like isoform X1 n=2 Tax=Danaus plexippus TaxID=13037 RepID=UPI002AB1BB55|nr:multiple C2 and transmembrane domain-containing protein-like isoform X1 [Danaus plexippus]XP_061378359.1 multiple C2 and transmembrane domain-containing protein-like isoform X1 [Danaus plexippus]